MSPPFGFDIGYSIPLVALTAHLVPHVVDQRGIKSIPGPGLAKFTDAGSLLEVASPFVNCTDNTVRPFLLQFQKLTLFYLTHAPRFVGRAPRP